MIWTVELILDVDDAQKRNLYDTQRTKWSIFILINICLTKWTMLTTIIHDILYNHPICE